MVNLNQLRNSTSGLRQYAARGVAAALAIPSVPRLEAGHSWVGVGFGAYDDQHAVGIAFEHQITKSFNFGVGLSGPVTGGSTLAARLQLGYGG